MTQDIEDTLWEAVLLLESLALRAVYRDKFPQKGVTGSLALKCLYNANDCHIFKCSHGNPLGTLEHMAWTTFSDETTLLRIKQETNLIVIAHNSSTW